MKFLKALLLTTVLVSAFNASASENHIFCGDVNKWYLDKDMGDLSASFREKYYNQKEAESYKAQGYEYGIAGRNCGLNSYAGSPEYDVLLLFKGKNFVKETINLGPFSIFHAKIFLNEVAVDQLEEDVILTGNSKGDLVSEEAGITGRLVTGRGLGKVKVIIRMHK